MRRISNAYTGKQRITLNLEQMRTNPATLRPAALKPLGAATLAILFVQLMFGALVAGLNAGLVTNEKVNVVRRDFDQLKAVLTNCVRFGPGSQNRDRRPDFRSHLSGKVSFVEMINPAKGNRLRDIFERIPWERA